MCSGLLDEVVQVKSEDAITVAKDMALKEVRYYCYDAY